MPIYEYSCHHCGHELEIIQKIAEPPLETCPACTQNTLKKRISKVGFRLKGSGWYETDFKGKKKTEPEVEKTSETKKCSKTESTTSNSSATTPSPATTTTRA